MERNDGEENLSGELIRNITFARMVERMRALPPDRAAAGTTMLEESNVTRQSLHTLLVRTIDASGLTRYEISQRSGVSQSQLSRLVSGERSVSLDVAERILAAVDVRLMLDFGRSWNVSRKSGERLTTMMNVAIDAGEFPQRRAKN